MFNSLENSSRSKPNPNEFERCATCCLSNCLVCIPELAQEKSLKITLSDQEFISHVVKASDTQQPYAAHR